MEFLTHRRDRQAENKIQTPKMKLHFIQQSIQLDSIHPLLLPGPDISRD
jgi:hypothetical protein